MVDSVKINTCFFLMSLESGGTERFLLRFLEHYKKEINATIVCKSGKLGVLESDFIKLGAQIIPVKMGYVNLIGWRIIFDLFRKEEFSSVVDLTGNFGGIYMLIAKLAGIKKRLTFYRNSSNHFKETSSRLLYNVMVKYLVYKFSTNILSNSKFAFSFFYPSNKFQLDARFEVIPNGIDSERFLKIEEDKILLRKNLGLEKDKFIIGHVGRLDSSKNHETVLQIAAVLTMKYKNIDFLFCGKGTNSPKFKKSIKEKNLMNKVHLLGYREDIPKVLKCIDFFIFPSITEGQPNSLIEAMISGLPFLTSDIEPIKECVPNFLNNYMINPYDSNNGVKIISSFYENQNLEPFIEARNWAIVKYDSNKQFFQFYKKL